MNTQLLKLKIKIKNNAQLLKLKNSRITDGEGNGTPLQYSCLENPMDRGA